MSTNENETRARAMGWLPKEQFKGPEDHWVDADAYLKRGEEILPILQANNRSLTDRVVKAEQENAKLQTQLRETQESIQALKEFNSTLNKDKVKDQKKELLTALAEAKREGNVDQEVMLTDQLSELNATLKAAAEKPVERAPPTAAAGQPQLTPEAKAWMAKNTWFSQDKRKTGLAMGISDEFKANGGVLGTQEHFDYVDQELAKAYPDENAERRQRGGKTEGVTTSSGGNSGGGSARGRSYADLPPEAKKACQDAADRLVGPNRAYKTLAEWQKRYVDVYDWS